MYAISLTSIPPRYEKLGPVLRSLLAQSVPPDRVLLILPRDYQRFGRARTEPDVPAGVEVIWCEDDLGPAMKVLIGARRLEGSGKRMIYCDDDWLYPPHWAKGLLRHDGGATCGQAWDIARIGRSGTGRDIAQGFSGVCIEPNWLSDPALCPSEIAWPVDDIWLSGQLARKRISIQEMRPALHGLRRAFSDTDSLQNTVFQGRNRDQANRACAAEMHALYGIWPKLP
ncbi:MAG: hypothetical protein AAGA97_05245 [Pseudomonadota bacterium]